VINHTVKRRCLHCSLANCPDTNSRTTELQFAVVDVAPTYRTLYTYQHHGLIIASNHNAFAQWRRSLSEYAAILYHHQVANLCRRREKMTLLKAYRESILVNFQSINRSIKIDFFLSNAWGLNERLNLVISCCKKGFLNWVLRHTRVARKRLKFAANVSCFDKKLIICLVHVALRWIKTFNLNVIVLLWCSCTVKKQQNITRFQFSFMS